MIIHRINWGIYMRNKNNMHRGFTLAEMMIVMLILTIILAAFAPLMTKRKTVDLSSPWRWASNNSDIYYGTGSNQTAMIGQKEKANTDPNAKLLINQSDTDKPYISFKNGNNKAGDLFINPERGVMLMYANADVYSEDLDGDTAFGIDSMVNGSSYFGGTAFGYGALRYSNGARNTAIGASTLEGQKNNLNIEAGDNTAVGYRALQINQVGHYTHVGSDYIAEGSQNTAVGSQVLTKNTKGYRNTAVGFESLSENTTGNNNIAIGYNACEWVGTSSNKICIGSDSGPERGDAVANNNSEHIIWLGNRGADDIKLYIGKKSFGTFITEHDIDKSDKRLKNVSGENTYGLDIIKSLKTYKFTYKDDKKKTTHIGLIAQDLQKYVPEAIEKDEKGYLTIKRDFVRYIMFNAIKELDVTVQKIAAQVKDITTKIVNIEKQIKALQKENKELKAKVNSLEKQNKAFETRLKNIESKL